MVLTLSNLIISAKLINIDMKTEYIPIVYRFNRTNVDFMLRIQKCTKSQFF
jgi:hypothetical protein